jgi:REP element-mobilizing transposase RayT
MVGWASCPANRIVKRLKHINIEGYAYFVTTNIYHRQKIFSNPEIANIVLSAIFFLKEKGYYRIYSFVIMPEHLHLIILPQNKKTVSQIMHSLKSYTAKKINNLLGRSGKIWQDGFYERIIRNENDLREKAIYIENNPVRERLVEEPEKYFYSSTRYREKMDYF